MHHTWWVIRKTAKWILGAAATWNNQKVKPFCYRHPWNAENRINIIKVYIWTVSETKNNNNVRRKQFNISALRHAANNSTISFTALTTSWTFISLSLSLPCLFVPSPPNPLCPLSQTLGFLFQFSPARIWQTVMKSDIKRQRRMKAGTKGKKGVRHREYCQRDERILQVLLI